MLGEGRGGSRPWQMLVGGGAGAAQCAHPPARTSAPLPPPPHRLPPLLQTSTGANVSTLVYDVTWPLSQISLTSGQQYFITVQGSNEAGGWVGCVVGWSLHTRCCRVRLALILRLILSL